VNTAAIALLAGLRDRYAEMITDLVVSGMIGPRGDGYRPDGSTDAGEAEAYHESPPPSWGGR
jgi:homocysteine S-methyltransferase